MANFFNPDIGWVEKSLNQIIEEKKQRLEEKTGQSIDGTPGSAYSILNDSSSLVDFAVNVMLGLLLKQTSDFMKEENNKISTPSSSTHDAIVKRFFEFLPNLEYVSIENAQTKNSTLKPGQMAVFIIMKEPFLDTQYPFDIWRSLHQKGSGVTTVGDKEVTYSASSNDQIMTYKYSLGVRLYVYIKVLYLSDSVNYFVGDLDANIREIYKEVIATKYNKISRPLEYQDFTTTTYILGGIARTDFYYFTSTDPNIDITTIPEEDFTKNENLEIPVSQVLVFDLAQKIIIGKTDT